jgi:cyclase
MSRPRLCFSLLYGSGKFHLSRNFNLQSVGDFNWLLENYEFESISRSVDELIILNVDREERDFQEFIKTVNDVVKNCFMPVAVGGGIRSFEDARMLFDNGADKIVLNTCYFENHMLVEKLIANYGAQSIIASIDFKRDESNCEVVYTNNGSKKIELSLSKAVQKIDKIGAGEILLNSIDRDGTGMGFDINSLENAYNLCDLPIIASGGGDTSEHLIDGLSSGKVSAVTSAHLFNFMGDGIQHTRNQLISSNIDLCNWNFDII